MLWRLPNIPPPQDSSSDTLSHAVEDLRKIYHADFDVRKYLYLPHGKFAFTSAHRLHCGRERYTLSRVRDIGGSRSVLTTGRIAGHDLTCMIKTWDIRRSWKSFFAELYVLSHPKLLRWLQGDCIPHVIGVFTPGDGCMSIVMETPHRTGWHTAHPGMPANAKEAVITAFEMIHAQGVMHGNISSRNILIGDDGTVSIVNFGKCACLPKFDLSDCLPTCSRLDLEREMRAVKYCIGYRDAKLREEKLSDGEEGSSDDFGPPFRVEEMNRWDREAEGDYGATYFTLPWRMRSRPILNDGRPHSRPPSPRKTAAGEKLANVDFDGHGLVGPSACNPKDQLSNRLIAHHTTPEDLSHSIDHGVQPHDNVHPSKQTPLGSGVESPYKADPCPPTPGPSMSVTSLCAPLSSSGDPHTRRSPESFLGYATEQVYLALKRQRETDDAEYLETSRNVRRRTGVDAEKKRVVFHPDTHDNGLWSTGEEPIRVPPGSEGRMHVNFDKMERHCRRHIQHVNKVNAERRAVEMTREMTLASPTPKPTRERAVAPSDVPSGSCSAAVLPVGEQQVEGSKRKRPASTHLPNQHPPEIGDDGTRHDWRPWPKTYALLNTWLDHLPFGRKIGLATSNAARKRKLSGLEHPESRVTKRPRRDPACCIT